MTDVVPFDAVRDAEDRIMRRALDEHAKTTITRPVSVVLATGLDSVPFEIVRQTEYQTILTAKAFADCQRRIAERAFDVSVDCDGHKKGTLLVERKIRSKTKRLYLSFELCGSYIVLSSETSEDSN